MLDVVGELKAKLAELNDRLETIRAEEAVVVSEMQAFKTVIVCYDPSFGMTGAASPRRAASLGTITPTKRVTALPRGKNKRHIVLDILRRSERPVAAGEIALSFIDNDELADKAAGLNSHITSRFATVLNALLKQGLVRFELSQVGSNRRLWQIAR